MRPFEILTFIGLLFSLITLLFIGKRSRWFVYVPGLALFVALCHVVIEGVRWQMIPAYVLISILFLTSLKQIFGVRKDQTKHPSLLKRILRTTGIVVAFLLFIITLIPPLAMPMFKIPHPSGKFRVGSSILFFRDTTRTDKFSREENRFRELSVRVWYPASNDNKAKGMPYMQIDEAGYMAIHLNAPAYQLSHLKLIRTDSYLNAEPLKDLFPVIFYSPSGRNPPAAGKNPRTHH